MAKAKKEYDGLPHKNVRRLISERLWKEKPSHEHETKITTIEQAARELLAVLQCHGDWDDGCFYYNEISSPELQKPIQDLCDALEGKK